jgi:engulfment/cell motility protein 1
MPEAHTAPSPFGTAPIASALSFSIMISQGAPLADHVSENVSRFSDWVDGLNMLRNSQITTRDTESYVQTLTEIGLKIKLLGELHYVAVSS